MRGVHLIQIGPYLSSQHFLAYGGKDENQEEGWNREKDAPHGLIIGTEGKSSKRILSQN
jgi:hypothetical protein